MDRANKKTPPDAGTSDEVVYDNRSYHENK